MYIKIAFNNETLTMQLFSFYKKKYDKRTKKMYIYCFEKLFF